MRLDIAWRDIFWSISRGAPSTSYRSIQEDTLRSWSAEDRWLATLSVRSAFDLALRALDLPASSEILMSAITVPDMAGIARAHQLVPVPVDLTQDGQLCPDSLQGAINTRTKVLVAAHLFGGQLDLSWVSKLCQTHGIWLFEDCAQNFTKAGDAGQAGSDLVMYSFGPIKTATALGGAVVSVKDDALRERMRELLEKDPIQSARRWHKRVLKFSMLKALTNRAMAAMLYTAIRLSGGESDHLVNQLGKGFAAGDIVTQIRYRPHPQLLRLLARRWQSYDYGRIERRRSMGRNLDALLRLTRDPQHSYWTFPLQVSQPYELAKRLRSHGYDAAHRTRLVVLEPPSDAEPPRQARELSNSWCFLPWYPELPDEALVDMAGHIEEFRIS